MTPQFLLQTSMKNLLQNPYALFIALALIIALPLFLFPINLFPGEIIIERKLVQITEKAPLSLSYFIGLGYNVDDMSDVKDFYLLTQGYILAGIFIIGIPFLAAYRVYLGNRTKK